ncbi:MAG: xanthine dehydrogenase family protein subunit M [Candidatus Wallbacteria bacterium]|nr:xanthine dehydrogenase family protein subunit M [Candidatus Wallbacteria bacterium]
MEYLKPVSRKELHLLLKKKGKNLRLLAGGTDLLVRIRHGKESPALIVDLKGIRGFDKISSNKKFISIGPCVTLQAIAEHDEIRRNFPALAEASRSVGSWQIRNRAPLAGNICNASPAADTLPVLVLYDARVKLSHSGRRRILSMKRFLTGPGKSALRPDEYLSEIRLPLPGEKRVLFEKFSRRKGLDLSTVSLAAGIFGRRNRVRLAIGACAPIVKRQTEAEDFLNEHGLQDKDLELACSLLQLSPITDLRGKAAFRRHIAARLVVATMKKLREDR